MCVCGGEWGVDMVEGEGPDLKRRLKTVGSVLPVLDTPVKDAAATLHRCLRLLRLQLERDCFLVPPSSCVRWQQTDFRSSVVMTSVKWF